MTISEGVGGFKARADPHCLSLEVQEKISAQKMGDLQGKILQGAAGNAPCQDGGVEHRKFRALEHEHCRPKQGEDKGEG